MEGIYTLQQMARETAQWGNIINIAEDLQGDPWVTQPVPSGLGFDAQWDDGLYFNLHDVLTSKDDNTRNMNTFQSLIYGWSGSPSWRVIYSENHDKASGQGDHQGRWPNIVDRGNPTSWQAQKLTVLAMATIFTIPGLPMLFSGQEFLNHQDFVFGQVPDMDWAQVGWYTRAGGWTRVGPYKGIFDLTQQFISLRLNKAKTTAGLISTDVDVYYNSASDKVIVFQRQNVIVLMNLSGRAFGGGYGIGITATGTWQVRVNTDLRQWSSVFGDIGKGITSVQATSPGIWGKPAQVSVPLGAYTAIVLSQ